MFSNASMSPETVLTCWKERWMYVRSIRSHKDFARNFTTLENRSFSPLENRTCKSCYLLCLRYRTIFRQRYPSCKRWVYSFIRESSSISSDNESAGKDRLINQKSWTLFPLMLHLFPDKALINMLASIALNKTSDQNSQSSSNKLKSLQWPSEVILGTCNGLWKCATITFQSSYLLWLHLTQRHS